MQDARSFIQATEGYLDETTSVLQRMRELSIQAGNGIYSSNDRKLVQIEIDQLVAEVDRIAAQSQFNGMNILTGRFQSVEAGGTGPISFHIGANVDQTGIDFATISRSGQCIAAANVRFAGSNVRPGAVRPVPGDAHRR